jgi:3-oxoacyl-[acyl-carrier-protein] synthase-3
MPKAIITGTGGYVPPRVVTNDQLAKEYGIDTTHEWIVQRTGIEERHYADEGIGSADLGLEASKVALERAGLAPRDLDLILFATLSPEMHFPGSGVLLQRKLGLCDGDPKFVGAMDIRNQCSGFLYGLQTAAGLVESGRAKNVLLVCAETLSAELDFSTRGRSVTSLFGDGAGAVVVSATDDADRGVRSVFLGADGRHAEALCLPVWDIRKRPYIPQNERGNGEVVPEMGWPQMEGKVVFRNAVEKMCLGLMQACWAEQLEVKDIDLFVFHQANMRINEYVANQMGIPADKLVHNIQKYGNTTAATIPLLLWEAERDGKLKKGMTIAMVAFGSGFTWGSAIMTW